MLGFLGFPLTGGFWGKIYVFAAAYDKGWWWLIVIGVVFTMVSAAYYLARRASVVILEGEHVPAYHTTGRSAALHSETYGSKEIRAITVASGRFYRKPLVDLASTRLLTCHRRLRVPHAERPTVHDR
jgi:D-arginine dehydrogenase